MVNSMPIFFEASLSTQANIYICVCVNIDDPQDVQWLQPPRITVVVWTVVQLQELQQLGLRHLSVSVFRFKHVWPTAYYQTTSSIDIPSLKPSFLHKDLDMIRYIYELYR